MKKFVYQVAAWEFVDCVAFGQAWQDAKIKAAENKPVPKSKWQQRLEEAQRIQQAQLKEQQKKQRR